MSFVCAVMDADVGVRARIYNSSNKQTLLSVLGYLNRRWRMVALTTAGNTVGTGTDSLINSIDLIRSAGAALC